MNHVYSILWHCEYKESLNTCVLRWLVLQGLWKEFHCYHPPVTKTVSTSCSPDTKMRQRWCLVTSFGKGKYKKHQKFKNSTPICVDTGRYNGKGAWQGCPDDISDFFANRIVRKKRPVNDGQDPTILGRIAWVRLINRAYGTEPIREKYETGGRIPNTHVCKFWKMSSWNSRPIVVQSNN